MYDTIAEPKALQLSKEETLALLDMCMNSRLNMEAVHEQTLTKLGDLARSYMAEEVCGEAAELPVLAPMAVVPVAVIPMAAVPSTAVPAPEPAYEAPARVAFWTRGTFRSRLHSLPPMPEVEACR